MIGTANSLVNSRTAQRSGSSLTHPFASTPARHNVIIKHAVLKACFFSVVVPAFQEEKHIARCLSSLASLKFDSSDFEVILIDNGSRDRTIEIASRFSSCLQLTILCHRALTIAALRNLGASVANGQYLCFLDADCVASPGWMEHARRLFGGHQRDLIGGHCAPPEDCSWVPRIWLFGRREREHGAISYLPAANLMIKRDIFIALGGFDASLETNEECDLCRRARKFGSRIVGYPELGVIHLGVPESLAHFFRKQRWHGKSVLKVFLRDWGSQNLRALGFAAYTLAALLSIMIVGTTLLWSSSGKLLLMCCLILVFPAFVVSLRETVARRNFTHLLPLFVLYFTYGLARALSLADFRNWSRTHE